MFAYIKGILVEKNNGYIVVETNGIGYKIFMSESLNYEEIFVSLQKIWAR